MQQTMRTKVLVASDQEDQMNRELAMAWIGEAVASNRNPKNTIGMDALSEVHRNACAHPDQIGPEKDISNARMVEQAMIERTDMLDTKTYTGNRTDAKNCLTLAHESYKTTKRMKRRHGERDGKSTRSL